MKKLDSIFMGTPSFGVAILAALIKEHNVKLVVTQTDKVNGKKKYVSPVKELAIQEGIEVFQPVNIRKDYDKILATPCDLIVTAAYGQIIGTKVLAHPRYASINVHGSLLPRYRGGAPIQRSIINGDKETGITIMYMAKGMDSGDILREESIEIGNQTSDELFASLANLGAKMINPVINDLVNGKIEPVKQDESLVTYAPNLTKEDELIDFNKDAFLVCRQVRGLNSNPGAYFTIDGNVYKIYDCEDVKSNSIEEVKVIEKVEKDSFTIRCKENALKVKEIKPAGKNKMSVRDYLNGKGKDIIFVGRKID